MPGYKAPVDDVLFILNEMLGFEYEQDIDQAIEELTRTRDVLRGMLREREAAEQHAVAAE